MKVSIKADPWLLTHNCDHLLILGLHSRIKFQQGNYES